jgi:hypothetical protein
MFSVENFIPRLALIFGLAWIIQCAVKRRWFLVGESPARELIRSAR